MKQAIALALIVTLPAASRAEDSYALLRSGARIAITDVSTSGITPAPEKGRPSKPESLAQVKSVSGPLAPKFEENRSLAHDLWRAASRLAREDEGGAEPLYEKLWTLTSGVSGPTRAEIASGLATCRVRRGALATAIEPWVEWVRQSSSLSPDQLALQRTQMGISDPAGWWLDSLPPIWSETTAVRALAARPVPAPPPAETHPSGDDLTLIYTIAARRDTGQPWQIDPALAIKDPAWSNLAGEMVLSESDLPQVRAEARQRLTARLAPDAPLWKQSWIRLALGRSLILEPGADDRRAGVLNLLWIASRPSAPSALTAMALVSASNALVLLADLDGARSLLNDLERRFPADPLLDSPGVATVRRALSQASAAASQSAPPAAPSSPPPD